MPMPMPMTKLPQSRPDLPDVPPEEWARRRRNNIRLGIALGGLVVLLFVLSLWKYRPL